MLRRKSLATLEKDDLAKYVGQSLFALAKSNNLDTQMFVAPSSLPDVSLGDTIGGIESIIGKEIAAQLSIEVKKTCSGVKRKITCLPIKKTILRETSADDELDWPINPVDCISFFIRQLWPFEFDLDYDMDATEEEKEQLWVDTITKFWFDLAEPIRQLLVTVFNAEVATKFVDVEPIPVDTPTRDAPIKLLKTMICLPYSDFRAKVSERIWHDLDPSLREEIFEIYRQQAEMMCEAIQDEYHGVYSEKLSLAQNADVLLDIFLEVPPRRDDDPRYTGSFSTESCDSFVVRMEETMNRWNELITEVKTNEDILWDPQALTELNSFEPMFAHSCRRRKVAPTLEFCVHNMIHEFLYRALSCTQKLPSSFCFKDEVEKFWDDYVKPGNFQGLPDSHTVECDARCKRLLRDFRALSTYIHTTRHAFIALMPLLPHLSKMGSKRLVYALFIQRKCNRGTKWSWPRCEFSDKHFGAHKFYPLANIPCAHHDDSDFERILEWHRHRYSYLGSSEEDILGHILGLPLPENIVSSMGEFMVENLYQENIDDVDETKIYNATGVMRYLERFCYEKPESAHIVWECIREAIQNAIVAVQDLDEDEISPTQRANWVDVIKGLIIACIGTRARRLISHLRGLYQGIPLALLPENFVTFRKLAERIKQKPPILIDTASYHSLRSIDLV